MFHAKVVKALYICNVLKLRRVLLVYTIGLNRYNVPKSTHKGTLGLIVYTCATFIVRKPNVFGQIDMCKHIYQGECILKKDRQTKPLHVAFLYIYFIVKQRR